MLSPLFYDKKSFQALSPKLPSRLERTSLFKELLVSPNRLKRDSVPYRSTSGLLKELPAIGKPPQLKFTNINHITLAKQPHHRSLKSLPALQDLLACYGQATDPGIIRDYNEDRLVAIPDFHTKLFKKNLRRCHFFGVYDGHGGTRCCEFLKQHLHMYIVNDRHFPHSPEHAITQGFLEAEKEFLQINDDSGSCAVVVLIVDNFCFVGNTGDSRAVMCKEGNALDLTYDHKPLFEKERIKEAGGRIYESNGVYRVSPGKLSVSRTFGDSIAKNSKPNVIIAEPYVKGFRINNSYEFIVVASDGVFDALSSDTVVRCVRDTLLRNKHGSLNAACEKAAFNLIQMAMNRQSLDNVSAIVIGLQGLKNLFINNR